MGSGNWSADVYETAERLRKGKSAFTYSDSGARSVHPDLDPFDVGRALAGIGAYHGGGKGRDDRALRPAGTPRALPAARSGKDDNVPPGSVLL